MNTTSQPVSQETLALDADEQSFLAAWKDAVELAGHTRFGHQAGSPAEATHWHQLTPKLDEMRKVLPNRCQAEAVFVAALASYYNAEEGQRLLTKAGCTSYGSLAQILDKHRRTLLAVLMINYQGW